MKGYSLFLQKHLGFLVFYHGTGVGMLVQQAGVISCSKFQW
jgi:hypothetical protein